VFSFTYGTSFALNDSGLRPTTIFSPAVWGRAGEGLWSVMVVNDLPPRLDPRAWLVFGGSSLAILACLRLPGTGDLPLNAVMMTVGALASAPFAHAHGYPGRLSIHLVASAVAVAVSAAALLMRRAIPDRHRVLRDASTELA
jgi:hypothetical protein